MDIRCGAQIVWERKHGSALLDPRDEGSILDAFHDPVMLPSAIYPRTFALLGSEEVISIPEGMVGLIHLRSTWARFGLISPPTVCDPGFKGQVTFEVYNASSRAILVRPRDTLWSIVWVRAEGEPIYTGRYQGQTGITLPKALRGEA